MNAIELKHVTKSYKDFQIQDMTFELPTGCIMGLIGENGAGKSTTIKMILDITSYENGEIKVLGKNHQKGFEKVKEDIGVVLDEAEFPEFITVKQVNKVMKYIYKNWEEGTFYQLVRKFNLPETKKRFSEFSRGMKMKLAIAVALSHQAKLLVLDEPTGGLDPVIRDEILDIFYDFTREEDHSILISSHIVGDLEKLCDYIGYIHQGRLKIFEEKDLLLEQYGILKCSKEELEELDPSAVCGVRDYRYGLEVLVDKKWMPTQYETQQPGLEDIIVFLAKNEKEGIS